MTEYRQIAVGEILEARSGRARYTRDYMDAHPGDYPVYSASLTRPFGFVNDYDHEGRCLTWVMNGYGGRVQEIDGRFAASRDRGVFVARDRIELPDLTYLRFAMEPQLVAAAVGRRVDGRLNEYTKIYPTTAESVLISLPLDGDGNYDFARMTEIGDRLRRIELRQEAVRDAQEPLTRATFPIQVQGPTLTIPLSDERYFRLSIGERVLRNQLVDIGIPVYSANALVPFGFMEESNLSDFDETSLLWGIDGVFDWNTLPAGEVFGTTDHCGRLQILDDNLDADYVYCYLKSTRNTYGFDRVFRASLKNMKADVQVVVPTDESGVPSLERQRVLADEFRTRQRAQANSLAALDDVLRARLTAEL